MRSRDLIVLLLVRYPGSLHSIIVQLLPILFSVLYGVQVEIHDSHASRIDGHVEIVAVLEKNAGFFPTQNSLDTYDD